MSALIWVKPFRAGGSAAAVKRRLTLRGPHGPRIWIDYCCYSLLILVVGILFLLMFCICCTTIISEWGVSSAGGYPWRSSCAYSRSGGTHNAANITGRPKAADSPRRRMHRQWRWPRGAILAVITIGPCRGHQFLKRRNNTFHEKYIKWSVLVAVQWSEYSVH